MAKSKTIYTKTKLDLFNESKPRFNPMSSGTGPHATDKHPSRAKTKQRFRSELKTYHAIDR